MSYSQDVKKLICDSIYKSSCCRRALLFGIISSVAKMNSSDEISVSLSNDVTDFFEHLLNEFYSSNNLDLTKRRSSAGKTNMMFKSKKLSEYLSTIDNMGNNGCIEIKLKCNACKGAFLRGVFLAVGKLSDPSKQFCLELSLGNRTKPVLVLLNKWNMHFLESARKSADEKNAYLYTKRSSVIEDFFGMAGLEAVTYDVINSTIKKSVNNHTNRCKNVEFTNIEKSVASSKEQTEIIEMLIRTGLINYLPEELISTARLRVDNPGVSLAYLARISNPPLTKSGISHRLSKIIKIGTELLKSKKS